MKRLNVAVAGNPNSGKSTLINAIAGTSLQVGNWPGVTVEKKMATLKIEDLTINLVDLPGTYSLSPYTQEEVIARDFLVKEKPDIIIDVVDSTNLERNLYLTVQLLELGIPVILALNIFDEAKKKGYEFDIVKLEELLGVKVIPTVATKKDGVENILHYIKEFAEGKSVHSPKKINYGEDIENSLKIIEEALKTSNPSILSLYPSRWLALKILEEDQLVLKETGINEDAYFLKKAKEHFINAHEEDIESILADIRYGIASGVTREILSKREVRRLDLTERIDRVVLNRYLGIPIFLTAMWLVFKIAFDFSSPLSDWIDSTISGVVTKWSKFVLETMGTPEWLVSLVTEGVIAGVGAVLVFLPVIAVMMFIITFLEGSGYMARAAFVMDRLMHSIGLHGKSFIPMLLGFGCNVPSIYATRVLETERDRKLTAMLVPLMSCGARLPVYVIFIGAFFAQNAANVLWSLYVLGILIAVLLGLFLKRTLFKGFAPVFIMELPPYRVPVLRDLMVHTWQKLKHFVVKAGTYIFAVSIIMWFLLNTPYGVEKENSILGRIGKTISPVFAPLGFGTWEASSSLVAGLIAKEVVVSTMAQIYVDDEGENKGESEAAEVNEEGRDENLKRETERGFFEDLKDIMLSFAEAIRDSFVSLFSGLSIHSLKAEEDEEQKPLQSKLKGIFSPLSAYAFLVFVLLYWPCVVVGIAMRQEFGSWKLYGQTMIIHSALAWLVAFLIFQGGKMLGF
ncbi:ferrous iron transport protein B [Thermodesulfovibrio sp.]|uniref:ferrous iron transport protein B n=1 Tax=Thermodesulfovibrio sp. TaxID=2067987 RepID=UPI0030B64F44